MARIGQIQVQQMVDDIKVEARIKGSDNLNITVLALINECLLAHTEAERYSVFVKTGVPVTLSANIGKYNLPDDFQNMRQVYFWRDGQAEESRTLRHKNDFVERSRDGSEPNFYELVGNQISIWPHAGVLVSDHLTIDYWAEPNALEFTDIFPVGKLYPVIKREVIARIHTYNKDWNGAQLMSGSSSKQGEQSMTSEDNGDTQ